MVSILGDDQLDSLDGLRLKKTLNDKVEMFTMQNTPPPEPAAPTPQVDMMEQFKGFGQSLLKPFQEAAGAEQFQQFGDALMAPFREKAQQESATVPSNGIAPVDRRAVNAPTDIAGYIRQAAQARGIDPDVALRVAMSEGGVDDPTRQSDYVNPKTGKREESYGPFQLYMGGGLGNRFQEITGKSPSDPSVWQQGVDFALDEAAKGGWGPWYGAERAGIASRQGLENARPVGISQPGATASPASPAGAPQSGSTELIPARASQFGDPQLSSAEANAACGPAAAIAFAQRTGRNPTLREATDLAATVGWTPGAGMAGPQSQVALLKKMGVAASMRAPDEAAMAADVQRGNPVIVDSPGHYFSAEGYDPKTRKFNWGASATDLRASGGNAWWTLDELSNLGMGAARTAIHMDNPETPAPSVVAGKSQAMRVENAPELTQAVDTTVNKIKGLSFDQAMAQDRGMQMQAQPFPEATPPLFNPNVALDPSQVADRRGGPEPLDTHWGNTQPGADDTYQDDVASGRKNPKLQTLVGQDGAVTPGTEPGDFQIPNPGVEPGDFQIPGRPIEPAYNVQGDISTASPSAQPDAVEPTVSPPSGTDQAPAPGDLPPTKFERQRQDIVAAHPPEAEPTDPWHRVGNAIRDAMMPAGIEENPEPQFTGVKPVQRQPVVESNPPIRDIRGDYSAPVQEDVIQRNPGEQAQGMTNVLAAQQAGIDASENVPQQVTQQVVSALGGSPDREVERASRGEAVGPLSWATEVSYGAADALLSKAAARAKIPGTDIAGRDVAAAALDPSNITSPFDLAGLAGGALIAGGLKKVGKNADQVLHVVNFGYKRGLGEEAGEILERTKALVAPSEPSRSWDEVAQHVSTYAEKRGYGNEVVERVGNLWAKADTRDLAAEMVTLMRGSDVAMDNLMTKRGEILERAKSGIITGEEADSLIDDLVKVASTDQFLLGNIKASKAVGRALNQLKGGVDVAESQAWIKSFDMLSKPISGAAKEIDRVVRSGKAGSGSAKRLEEAADAMESGAERFGDEAAEKAGATRRQSASKKAAGETEDPTVTPEQARNLPEFTGPKGVDPVKMQNRLDDEQAAKNLQAALENEEGTPGVRPQKPVDDRPDWAVHYPKKSNVPDLTGVKSDEPVEATLREQVKFREQMKRQLDNRIQKMIDAEKRADVRQQVDGMAKLAKSDMEKIISNPGGAGHQDIRDNLDILLRQMREHSNLGERVAADMDGLFNRRMDDYVKRFGATVERDIQRLAKQASREDFVALRKEADNLSKQIQADPQNTDLRRQFEDITKRIGEHESGGAYEAVKFYDKQAIRDEVRTLREIARVMRENPRELFQTGYVDMLNKHFDALQRINQQGRDRAESIRESLMKRGARKMLGQQADEDGIRTFLTSLAHVDFNDPVAVRRYMDTVAKGSTIDMAIEGMMASMLSSPVTQGVNLLSNVAQGVSYFGIKKPAMIAYDALMHANNRSITSKELSAANRGIREGLATGVVMAGEVLRYGSTQEARTRAGALADFSDMRREYLTERFGPVGVFMHVPSTRALEMSDTLFGQMYYNANLRSLAERKALKSNGELKAIDIIGNLDQHMDVVEAAGKLSDYSLLKQPGAPSAFINEMIRRSGNNDGYARLLINMVMPFTRVPYNFLKQGLDHSALMVLPNAGMVGKSLLTGSKDPVREADLATKAAAGLALSLGAIGLYQLGWITGDGPGDREKKEMWLKDHQPRSVKVGDRWLAYDNLPVTIPFAMVATALERSAEEVKKDPLNQVGAMASGLSEGAATAALNQSFIKNLGDAWTTMRRDGDVGDLLMTYGKNEATRFEPAMIAWMARLGDEYQRESRKLDDGFPTPEFQGAMKERLPGLRQTLPARQDVLGDPVPNDGNSAIIGPKQQVIRSSPVVDAFTKAGVDIPSAPTETSSVVIGDKFVPTGAKIKFTEEQRRAYQRYLGDALKSYAPGIAGAPPKTLEMMSSEAQKKAMIALQTDPKYAEQIQQQFSDAMRKAPK